MGVDGSTFKLRTLSDNRDPASWPQCLLQPCIQHAVLEGGTGGIEFLRKHLLPRLVAPKLAATFMLVMLPYKLDSPMLTEDDIRDALRACFDTQNPFDRPLNIVDLGLVESITLTPDPDAPGAGIPGVPPRQSLALALLPSSPDEDATSILLAQIQNRLAGLPDLSRTAIRLLDNPPWTPSRIAPELRRTLLLDPPAFPILNNRR